MKKESKIDRRRANLGAALAAAAEGCRVFPCSPKTKAPYVKWKEEATTDMEKIHELWSRYRDAVPAIVTGEVDGFDIIDLDVKNGKDGVVAYRDMGLDPEDAVCVVSTAGGGLHLYFEHVEGVGNAVDKFVPGIDVRGTGGYVIAPGAVMDHGTYVYAKGDLESARLISGPVPEAFLPGARSPILRTGLAAKNDPEDIRSALFYVPNDQNYQHWVRTLMALHAATAGSEIGLELAQEWSSGYPGYDPGETKGKWDSFDASRANGITAGTLFAEARANGWDGEVVPTGTDIATWVHPAIEELNKRFSLVRMGTKVVIAETRSNGDIEFISTQAFRELFSNRRHGEKTLGNAWITHSKRRTHEGGVTFRPDDNVPPQTLNLWTGFALSPKSEKHPTRIISHLRHVVADGNELHFDYIVAWLAHLVQKPAEKPGVALVLKGKKGAGKDTLAEFMKRIVGRRHYAHVPASERLTGRFNAAFATAILIHVEEAIWGGQRESKGIVQSMITCPEMPLERKNVDTVQVDSFCRLIFTTNESWAVPATADERRYAVFNVSAKCIGDREYFDALWREIENGGCEAFLDYLLAHKQPECIDLRTPPRTVGLMKQKLAGLRGVERWWYEQLCVGDWPWIGANFEIKSWQEDPQSAPREVLRHAYQEWMSERRYQGDIVGPAEFGEQIKAMCPALKTSRPTEGGQRVRRYKVPRLKACRAAFSTYMGGKDEIEWSD